MQAGWERALEEAEPGESNVTGDTGSELRHISVTTDGQGSPRGKQEGRTRGCGGQGYSKLEEMLLDAFPQM